MYPAKFSREIALILIIKLTLLYCLWNFCFKTTKQKVVGNKFANQIFGEQPLLKD